ncbi:hypothetical protein AA0120_g6816 [Alternaria tenuissima]|nr:hypothetical protein AA0120_g6816 [Alternaria tenuissima]
MRLQPIISAFGLLASVNAGLLRFGCAQLTVQRLDPLVNPGANPSPHLHQIIGGNSFNVTMDPTKGHYLAAQSTCTTCEFTEDLSNYWTAVVYFKAKNGTFKRVPQRAQQGMEGTNGGMCWDGVNLDSPNHREHVSYPATGTFENGGACPSTHPIRIPQILLETVWDTKQFNNKADWPTDGSQPFLWSSGDATGFSTHADYLFGWKDNSLQKAMDGNNYVSAPTLKKQNIATQNRCNVKDMVGENFDGWLTALPGGMQVN